MADTKAAVDVVTMADASMEDETEEDEDVGRGPWWLRKSPVRSINRRHVLSSWHFGPHQPHVLRGLVVWF